MGRGSLRAGAPSTGTEVASGTDNDLTDPRIIIFAAPVRPCIVTNHCTNQELLVKINTELNGTVSETFSQANGLGHFVIPPKSTKADASKDHPEGGENWVDVSLGGQVSIHSVAFATTNAGDDLDDVSVVGWDG